MSYESFEYAKEGLLKTFTKNLDQYYSGGHIECDTVTLRHWLMSFIHTLYLRLTGKKDVHPDLSPKWTNFAGCPPCIVCDAMVLCCFII
jgi:hypothetical protein